MNALNSLYGEPTLIDDTGDEDPSEDETPVDDETPADEDPGDDMGEDPGEDPGEETPIDAEEDETPTDAEEDDDAGIGAIFARIFDIFLSIFSFLGGGSDDTNYTARDVQDDLDEVEDLLSQLVPMTEMDEDAEGVAMEEEEEMEMMA